VKPYSLQEEIANSITHGIGLILSVVALVALVVLASVYGTAWHVVSFTIYGVSLAVLYTASTLYHSFQRPRVKYVLRIVDHSSIYLLIAGTYTPLGLVVLRGGWGWSLFGVIWGLAVIGIVFQSVFPNRFRGAATVLYAVMGWLVIVAFKPLLAGVAPGGVRWLLAGGFCYTLGIGFYLMKRIPYHHAVWHLMVLAGSACHFVTVIIYILPVRV